MTRFADSYLGGLRALVGDRLLQVPGARIVIEDGDGKILLQKRADFDLWGLPGGTAEEGESLIDTIIREVQEETGLRIVNPRIFGFATDPRYETIVFPNGDRCQFHTLQFYCREFGGAPTDANEETLQLAWAKPDELPEMLPNMRRSVDAYRAFKLSGRFQLL